MPDKNTNHVQSALFFGKSITYCANISLKTKVIRNELAAGAKQASPSSTPDNT